MSRVKFALLVVLFLVLLGTGYVWRGTLRDIWQERTRPTLPTAIKFDVKAAQQHQAANPEPALIEGGVAASEHFSIVSSPPPAVPTQRPWEKRTTFPSAVNLDVPFMSQAPLGDWSMPYQEACEEASVLMVDAFYRNVKLSPQQAKEAIDAVVAAEKGLLGYYEDTSVSTTAALIDLYFKRYETVILPLKNAEGIQRIVASGYPVIIPAAGKLLPNPNFRNGGPLYHMLVVRGYTEDGLFITNDPGTRKGEAFTYRFADLMHAAHDWNNGDVLQGEPTMLVMIPRIL
jgi:hypothetical protein